MLKYNYSIQITISTPTRPDWTRNLPDEEAKIGRALAGGNITSFAKAVMSQNGIRKEILELVLHDLESECASLCKRSAPSRFRKMGLQEMIDDFQWERLMSDLRTHAPLLLRILTSIVSTNDHRNKNKCRSCTLSWHLHGHGCDFKREEQGDVWYTITCIPLAVFHSCREKGMFYVYSCYIAIMLLLLHINFV